MYVCFYLAEFESATDLLYKWIWTRNNYVSRSCTSSSVAMLKGHLYLMSQAGQVIGTNEVPQ